MIPARQQVSFSVFCHTPGLWQQNSSFLPKKAKTGRNHSDLEEAHKVSQHSPVQLREPADHADRSLGAGVALDGVGVKLPRHERLVELAVPELEQGRGDVGVRVGSGGVTLVAACLQGGYLVSVTRDPTGGKEREIMVSRV